MSENNKRKQQKMSEVAIKPQLYNDGPYIPCFLIQEVHEIESVASLHLCGHSDLQLGGLTNLSVGKNLAE